MAGSGQKEKKEISSGKSLGVFDIGSNTVLLTGGRLNTRGQLEVLIELHDVARLSEGLVDGGPLQEAAKARTLNILSQFKAQANSKGVQQFLAAGTAAFRRASDGSAFAQEIQEKLEIPVKIIPGEREAHYSYLSAQQDFGSSQNPVGVIDIGGGSTELVFNESLPFFSLPVGTVRLLEKFVTVHPILDSQWINLRDSIRQTLQNTPLPLEQNPTTWVAVAATPTALACLIQELEEYDPSRVHGFKIKKEVLKDSVEKLRRLSVKDRDRLRGMIPKRAELLPLGGIILLEIMAHLGLTEVTASHHGLRYGILWEALRARVAT